MQENHPIVKSLREGEQGVSQQLHREIAIAIRGIDVDIKLSADRIATLKQQLDRDRTRLEKLASLRAEYGTLIATSENQTSLLESARESFRGAGQPGERPQRQPAQPNRHARHRHAALGARQGHDHSGRDDRWAGDRPRIGVSDGVAGRAAVVGSHRTRGIGRAGRTSSRHARRRRGSTGDPSGAARPCRSLPPCASRRTNPRWPPLQTSIIHWPTESR